MSSSMGLPDLGVITVDEVCFFIRQVARASGLPVLVDGDTGYGEALNVMHMVRAFEEAGAGAVHIEDQILPKKCGHLNNKKLAEPHDMAAKVAAAAAQRFITLGGCAQAIRIIEQALNKLPMGPVRSKNYKFVPPPRSEIGTSMEALIHHFKLWTEGFSAPAGSVYVPVESPRGELGCYLESDGGPKPHRVHFRTPSFVHLQALPLLRRAGVFSMVNTSNLRPSKRDNPSSEAIHKYPLAACSTACTMFPASPSSVVYRR